MSALLASTSTASMSPRLCSPPLTSTSASTSASATQTFLPSTRLLNYRRHEGQGASYLDAKLGLNRIKVLDDAARGPLLGIHSVRRRYCGGEELNIYIQKENVDAFKTDDNVISSSLSISTLLGLIVSYNTTEDSHSSIGEPLGEVLVSLSESSSINSPPPPYFVR
uniref:Uncharacterized protein n=1 Tax=Ananas comosus var. bracteatus TaxID=296719 RepID=A0A6V7QPR4_ANACO|nr:unnamed protein product [Ananas comosus var. bracteatus]